MTKMACFEFLITVLLYVILPDVYFNCFAVFTINYVFKRRLHFSFIVCLDIYTSFTIFLVT